MRRRGCRVFGMRAMVRHLTAFGGRVAVLALLFAVLTSPFSLRAVLDARAVDQAQAARLRHVFDRPPAPAAHGPAEDERPAAADDSSVLLTG